MKSEIDNGYGHRAIWGVDTVGPPRQWDDTDSILRGSGAIPKPSTESTMTGGKHRVTPPGQPVVNGSSDYPKAGES